MSGDFNMDLNNEQAVQQNDNVQQVYNTVNDNLFNQSNVNPEQTFIVTHNQYGMRWYLFLVWGFMIYYFVSIAVGAVNHFLQLETYVNMMKKWHNSYYTFMFVLLLVTVIFEVILAIIILRARKGLLELKKRGIKDLYISLITPAVYYVVCIVGCFVIAAFKAPEEIGDFFETIFSANFIITYGGWKYFLIIAAYIVFVVGNVKYFNNRKQMFIN